MGNRRLACCVHAVVIAAVVVCGVARPAAAAVFDPLLKFRVLSTAHFRIYFHQSAEPLAARLTSIAEAAWVALERPLGVRPPPLTHVVLADQTDLPNGYATPLPYNTIVIYTIWPPSAEFNADDWLRLVFTHEFTHIVHLDRSRGWARAVRGVFGRTPIAFPNLFLPVWQIEGLATYEESAITGEGRFHAGDFRAITEEAARHRALEPLDRINGGLTDWPSGQAAYAYGLAFHQYLADRFGAEKLATLAEETAGRVPYTTSPMFRRVFGESLGNLWREFQRATENDVAAAPTSGAAAVSPVGDAATARSTSSAAGAEATRLTHHGFVAAAPRFDRGVCASCPPSILYAKRTPHEFPSLVRIGVDGSGPADVTTRYFGTTTAAGRDEIYFDQLEVRRNVGLYGDLYALSRATGRVRQLTSEARVHDPDLSPDGTRIVCTQDRTGQRILLLVHLTADTAANGLVPNGSVRIELLVAADDTQFSAPRWSPDGRFVAAVRHRLGFDPEIVVVDVATRELRSVARADRTRIVMPVWRPDGQAIVAAVAPDDQVFNLVEFPLDGISRPRQLTQMTGGATWPDISPDGRTLVFTGYTVDGSDLFSIPYPAADGGMAPSSQPSGSVAALRTLFESSEVRRFEPPDTADRVALLSAASRYSPLPTLKPTSWSPVVEWNSDDVRIGAATGGRDVLGYHTYVASATWLVASPDGARTPSAEVPDWFVSYAYDRWRPTLVAAASSETSFFAGPATDAGTPSAATRRERVVEGGVILPFLRARTSHTALATMFRAVDDYTRADGNFTRTRTAFRAGWQTRTAHTYGYSISPEKGVIAGATAEVVDRALGASADATTYTVDARAFLPGVAGHHVVAARFAAGRSDGDPTVGRTFVLGGAAPDVSVIDFGSSAISLLRGFPSNSFAGSHVALANVEYRWPIARPQRGVGTWPIFLHTIHAAAFGDAGHAWTRRFRAGDIKSSVGGELSANVVAGYSFALTISAGAAWRRDGSGIMPRDVVGYLRLGKSF